MNAKRLFEFACPAPAAPPREKPGVAPTRERPGAPVRPSKRPNPFRRKDIKPGEEPKPKASIGGYAYEGKKLKQPAQGKKVKKAFKESHRPSRARALIEGNVDIDDTGAPQQARVYRRPVASSFTPRESSLFDHLRSRFIEQMETEGHSTEEAVRLWHRKKTEVMKTLRDPEVRKRFDLDNE